MTTERKLEILLSIAQQSGIDLFNQTDEEYAAFKLVGSTYSLQGLFFSHAFAQAVFGECTKWERIVDGKTVAHFGKLPKAINDFDVVKELNGWRYHLQQLAVTPEKDRIDYVWRHRQERRATT